jgi:hypothetical protein
MNEWEMLLARHMMRKQKKKRKSEATSRTYFKKIRETSTIKTQTAVKLFLSSGFFFEKALSALRAAGKISFPYSLDSTHTSSARARAIGMRCELFLRFFPFSVTRRYIS